jgi:hypothetical protein
MLMGFVSADTGSSLGLPRASSMEETREASNTRHIVIRLFMLIILRKL